MTIDSRSFRKALGCFASGVTVITALNPQTKSPAGVTVSAFSSLSLEPPLVMFCLGKQTSSLDTFRAAGGFVVNVLSETQRDLSIRFASRAEDKWSGLAWESWSSGAPVLANCLTNLECSLVNTVDGGDHEIFIGKVEKMRHQEGGSPLIYFRGSYLDLGPKAPLVDLV